MADGKLWHHGEDYRGDTLDESRAAASPFTQFATWFAEAEAANIPKVNAMALATVGQGGAPSVRMVLLKEVDATGFVFFTNYESRKGHELHGKPNAALLFYWESLDRQVRIEGSVERITDRESDAYFHARPRESRIGAIASPQSQVIESRAALEARVADVTRDVGEGNPERPWYWGGYRLVPHSVEFWQGQPNRLHDRLLYQPSKTGWTISRLAP